MKTLSAAYAAAAAGPVTRPGWLVEIAWSAPVRLSSQSTVSWNGMTWTAADIDVTRVRIGAASVGGAVVLGNADDVIGALVLNEGVSDRAIRIYGFDAAATALDDVVPMVDAVGGRALISARGDRVTIDLRDSAAFTYAPRAFVGRAAGFTQLLAAGTVLNLNGQTYTLARR